MRFCLYTNSISPHQLPLARELVGLLGAENYRYIYTTEPLADRVGMGWKTEKEPWIIPYGREEAQRWLGDADVVMMQHPRDWRLFEDRLRLGKTCLYASERWFKPIHLIFNLDGRLRMIHPGYRRMAKRFVSLVREYPRFLVLPVGIHAKEDFKWLGVPEDRIVDWGYFVAGGQGVGGRVGVGSRRSGGEATIKVLWVGRLLKLKRVDTIVRAVVDSCGKASCKITLDIYGAGPEEMRLKKMAAKHGEGIRFYPPVPIDEVRRLMREHDVYVLASNACEGWGAVVSEALEEGMQVFGSHEAGASATMLPQSHLFHAGDVGRLADLLSRARTLPRPAIGEWTAASAAKRLLSKLETL